MNILFPYLVPWNISTSYPLTWEPRCSVGDFLAQISQLLASVLFPGRLCGVAGEGCVFLHPTGGYPFPAPSLQSPHCLTLQGSKPHRSLWGKATAEAISLLIPLSWWDESQLDLSLVIWSIIWSHDCIIDPSSSDRWALRGGWRKAYFSTNAFAD